MGSGYFCMVPGKERLPLDLLRAVENIECALKVGRRSVWNS